MQVWTREVSRAHRLARDVGAGVFWVSTRASMPMLYNLRNALSAFMLNTPAEVGGRCSSLKLAHAH